MAIVAFSHIAIRVSNLEAALACYRDVLGFRDRSLLVVTDTPSFRQAGLEDAEMAAHFLTRDATEVELQVVRSRSGQAIPPELNLLGFRHLAFRVEGVRDAAEAVVDAGGSADWPTLTVTEGAGSAVFGADPDGQRLEFLELLGGPKEQVGNLLPDVAVIGDGTVSRFDHVAVGVRDLDRAIAFYTGCLGGKLETNDADHAMVRVFATRLSLERTTPKEPGTGIRALRFVGPAPRVFCDPDGVPLEVRAGQ